MKKVIVLAISAFLLAFGTNLFAQQNKNEHISKEEIQQKLASENNDSLKAYWQLELGRKLLKEKKYDDAIEVFEQSLAYQQRVNNRMALAKTNANIAVCYTGKLNLKKANEYYKNALQSASQVKDKQILSSIYNGLISTSNSMGNAAKGLEYTQQLLKLGQAENDDKIIGMAYYYFGYFYQLNNNIEKAGANFMIALPHLEAAHDTAMIARLQINIGEYYQSLNKPDSAKAYFTQSLETSRRLGAKSSMADLYERIGNLYAHSGDYDNYFKNLDQSIALAKELDDKTAVASYEYSKERAHFYLLTQKMTFVDNKPVLSEVQKNELDEIIKRSEKHIKSFKSSTINYYELSNMTEWLSGMKQLAGDYEGALNSYFDHVRYKDSFSSEESKRQFASVEAKYTFEKARDSLKIEEEQRRLALQREMELIALHHEFERKQALAKTEAERKQLLFEEEVKRKAIEEEYALKREAATAKYEQEKALAKANEEKEKALSLAELRKSNNARNISLLSAGLLLASAGVFGYGYSQKRKDNRKIAEEKKRSDELLLNILPAEIADELKTNGHSVAQQHPEVSVLFTDFVNFTQTSEKLGVEELVNELNINFTAFDRIMERYGLEKIKTIGDAYLAVSGLPVSNEQHAQNAVRAALEILSFVEKRKKEVPYGLDIRIGINSGALIAGIIGVKKFAYDIWGDTVNIAARMEQSGSPGKVNISKTTYILVKEAFDCTYRGKIDAKNKGELDMYFVNYLAKN